MRLGIRAATLMRGHITEQSTILSLIADKVSGFDILFGMGAIFNKRYHMIERESSRAAYDIWINCLLAYIAMIAVTLDNHAKIHLFYSSSSFACFTTTHCFHKEQTG